MTTNAVGGTSTNGVYTSATTTPTTHKTSLDGTDFLKLIMDQLKSQNPLDPMSDKDFAAQMAQMNSLEELQKMNTTLSQLTSANQMSEAASLIGRSIKANLADGSTAAGLVTSVSLKNGAVTLMLGTKQVPIADVVSVSDAETSANA